jgi:hypothetical protein
MPLSKISQHVDTFWASALELDERLVTSAGATSIYSTITSLRKSALCVMSRLDDFGSAGTAPPIPPNVGKTSAACGPRN